MATLIYYTGERSDTGDLIASTIEFDLVEDGKKTDGSVTTDVSIESGRSVVDHIRDKPQVVDIKAIFRFNPDKAIEQLQTIKTRRWLSAIVNRFLFAENLILHRISIPRDADAGIDLVVDLRFKQIVFADVSTGQVTADRVDALGPAEGRIDMKNKGYVPLRPIAN